MRWLALTLMLIATPVLAQVVPSADVARLGIEEVIRPGFTKFAEAAKRAASQMTWLCDEKTKARRLDAEQGFRDLVESFARIELLRFGPLVRDNRAERLLFFPDRKGIALRQVQGLLAEKDETATDPVALEGKSVAVQGLGALEFVLFGTGSETLGTPEGDYRCRYGAAAAAGIADVASAMRDEWDDPDGISRELIAPTLADTQYRSVREVLEELVGQMTFGIEAIRDQRILPVIGRDRFDPKPKSALFWRSGMTIEVIRKNFEGLADLYALSRIGAAGEGDSTWLENSVAYAFGNTFATLDKVSDLIDAALTDPAQVRALETLLEHTSTLQNLIGSNTATVLNLSVGFSSLDGD